jgi:hypothetical protein
MSEDLVIETAALGGPVFVFTLLALAVYRVVRFLCDDSLMGMNPRSGSELGLWFDRWGRTPDGDDRKWLRGRITDLVGCTYCLGWWVSLAAACLWLRAWPWQLGYDGWLYTIALAGAQALLNTLDHRLNS